MTLVGLVYKYRYRSSIIGALAGRLAGDIPVFIYKVVNP